MLLPYAKFLNHFIFLATLVCCQADNYMLSVILKHAVWSPLTVTYNLDSTTYCADDLWQLRIREDRVRLGRLGL